MVGRTIQRVKSHQTPPSARQQQHAKLSGDPHVRLLLYQQRPRFRRYLESALQLTRTDVNSVRPNDAPRQVIPINASSEAVDETTRFAPIDGRGEWRIVDKNNLVDM